MWRPLRGSDSVHTHHSIDYIEFPVLDMNATKAFYRVAFGWRFTDYGPDYAGIQGSHGEMGGLRRVTELRAGGALVVLYSNDLNASVQAVRVAGGRGVRDLRRA